MITNGNKNMFILQIYKLMLRKFILIINKGDTIQILINAHTYATINAIRIETWHSTTDKGNWYCILCSYCWDTLGGIVVG